MKNKIPLKTQLMTEKLKDMLEQGLITEEQFNLKEMKFERYLMIRLSVLLFLVIAVCIVAIAI